MTDDERLAAIDLLLRAKEIAVRARHDCHESGVYQDLSELRDLIELTLGVVYGPRHAPVRARVR